MIIIPDRVIRHPTLKESEKTLFGRILMHCLESEEKVCTLSNADLAQEIDCTFVTVSNGIKALKGAGFVVSRIQAAKANQRTLTIKESLLTESLMALQGLVKKIIIAQGAIKEICNSPIKDSCNSQTPIKEIYNSRLSPNYVVSEQVRKAIKDFCNSPGGISVFARRERIESILLINKIYTTLSSKQLLRSKNRKNSEVTPMAQTITVTTPSGLLAISAHELAGVVEIRGADPERVGGFVENHAGNHYNNIGELRNLVRAWLRQIKSDETKQPRLSLEERKLLFRDALNAYHRANPKKYPVDFYKQFFDHWTQPTKSGKRMEFETKSSFYLPTKLAYSYSHIYQRYNRQSNGNTGISKQTVTLSADDIDGSSDAFPNSNPDDAFHDLSGNERYTDHTIEIGGF